MASGWKISGIEMYMEKLVQADADILQAAVDAVDAAADVLVAGMRQRAPVLTGRLRDSIKKSVETDGDTVIAAAGVLDADSDLARYANVQEYGSPHTPQHSYIQSTLDADGRRARRAMRDKLKNYL